MTNWHQADLLLPILARLHGAFLSPLLSQSAQLELLDQLRANPAYSLSVEAASDVFHLENLIYAETIDHRKAEALVKLLAHLAKPTAFTNDIGGGIRLKYLDLATDYQYLLAEDVKELRLVELVSKKLNFLAGGENIEYVLDAIRLQVLVYYLLCGADFRKNNIHKYLTEENVFSQSFDPAIGRFVSAHESGALLPLSVYAEFIEHLLSVSPQFAAIYRIHSHQFLLNFVEVNLEKLPRYFKSIGLSRAQKLLLNTAALNTLNTVSQEVNSVDVEDVVSRMINGKIFPAGTKIDQIDNIVDFGEDVAKYDAFNTHIKKVCDLAESLALVA